jgi:hypothetical protein
MPAHITDAQKRKIRALHGKGLGRNAIAREVGCSLSTVTMVCRAAGLTFDRSATKVAVEARQVDLRAARQEVLTELYDIAREDIRRLKTDEYEYRVVHPTFTEVVTDKHAPSADRRNHMQTIASAMTTATRLEQVDGDATISKAASTITRLAEAFGIHDA